MSILTIEGVCDICGEDYVENTLMCICKMRMPNDPSPMVALHCDILASSLLSMYFFCNFSAFRFNLLGNGQWVASTQLAVLCAPVVTEL